MASNHNPEDLADFFRTRKIGFGTCLEPTMQCAQEPIRAHSIQNARTIGLLESKNHVFAWQPHFTDEGPEVVLKEVGRNEASTFTGFCNQHDTELFIPIDTKPLDRGDREQLFLLAYRALTCELHAIMRGVVQLQSLYSKRVERGIESGDDQSQMGQESVRQMLLSWATWKYRFENYDQALISKEYTSIEHDVIQFENQPACLAAASFFTVKDGSLAEPLIGTTINVLPTSETETLAVFSYPAKDRGSVRAALDRVLNSHDATQKYELSKLILSRISNLVIAPRHLETWTPEKTKAITDAFVETTRAQRDVGENAEFMLF